MTQDYSCKLHRPLNEVCSAALTLRGDPFCHRLVTVGEVRFGVRDIEIRGFCSQIELNLPWMFRSIVFWGIRVTATVKFELEMVACGFALPLLALCRHVPTLILKSSFSLISKQALPKYVLLWCCMTTVWSLLFILYVLKELIGNQRSGWVMIIINIITVTKIKCQM